MYCPGRLDQVGTASKYRPGSDPPPQHHAPHRLSVPFGIAEQPTADIDPLSSPWDGHLYCQRRRQITPSRGQALNRHRPPLEDLRSVDPLPVAHRVPSPRAATPRRPSQHVVESMQSSKGEDQYAVVPKQAVAQVHRNAETLRGPRGHRSPKESLRPLIFLPTSGSRCEKVKSPKSPKEMAGYEIRNYRGEG